MSRALRASMVLIESALLLLPRPPNPPTAPTVKAAFELPLRHVLEELHGHSQRSARSINLDIVVPCIDHATRRRYESFDRVCTLLVELYTVLESQFTALSITQNGSTSINARIIPLAWDPEYEYAPIWPRHRSQLDCVVDLAILVECKRAWRYLFTVETEQGERMYRQFRTVASSRSEFGDMQTLCRRVQKIPGGLVLHNIAASESYRSVRPQPHHQIVALSGYEGLTFTQKLLVTMAMYVIDPPSSSWGSEDLHQVRKVIFGIAEHTSLLNNEVISESYETRRQALEAHVSGVLDFRPPEASAVDEDLRVREQPLLVASYCSIKDEGQLMDVAESTSAIMATADLAHNLPHPTVQRFADSAVNLELIRLPQARIEEILVDGIPSPQPGADDGE